MESVISTLSWIGPIGSLSYSIVSFFIPKIAPVSQKNALTNFGIAVLLFAISVFPVSISEETASWGLGGIVILFYWALFALAVFLCFVVQVIIAHQKEKKLAIEGSEVLPPTARSVWITLAIGVIGAYAVLNVGSLITSIYIKNAHPYGLGKTKDTQFSGLYQSVNIGGSWKQYISLAVPDVLRSGKTYDGIHTCVFGYIRVSPEAVTLQAGNDPFTPADPQTSIWIAESRRFPGSSCPNGKTSCEGNISVCGTISASTSPAYGTDNKYTYQLEVIANPSPVPPLGNAPFNYSKYQYLLDVLKTPIAFEGKQLCVQGYFVTKNNSSVMSSGILSDRITPFGELMWADIQNTVNPLFCHDDSTSQKICVTYSYACGTFRYMQQGGLGYQGSYKYLLTDIDASSVLITNGGQ